MNEKQINAQFTALVEQRNVALNTVVNVSGELAVAKETIEVLQAQVADLQKQLATRGEVTITGDIVGRSYDADGNCTNDPQVKAVAE